MRRVVTNRTSFPEARQWMAVIFALGWITSGNAQLSPLSPQELQAALAAAKPGTTLEIASGVYKDMQLELKGKGNAEAPIIIRAEVPGAVIFSGRSSIDLRGEHLVLDGLWFKDGHAPVKTVIDIDGSHCRLTNSVIAEYNPPDPESREDKWLALRGRHHVVDRCTFYGKTSKSVTLIVIRKPGQEDHHLITLNHFHTRPQGSGRNGYETVRIGTSEELESDSITIVKSNLFEGCDGEMEIVSVKAGKCLISDNTFKECAGTLTLRHGNGSRVERNLFAGKKKKSTGGVRVYGEDHLIMGNMFIGLTGRGGGALALMAGTPDPSLNGYHRAQNVRIEGNLFAANQGPALKFNEQYGEDDRTLLPRGIAVRANVFSGDDLQGLIEGTNTLGVELAWERSNQTFANNQIPRDITATLPPPLTRADVGAAWYRDRLP